MPDILSLNSHTSVDAIRDYLTDAEPDARIGVRKGREDGSVELYRRDQLTGMSRFIDILTNAFSRRDNYKKAKDLIIAAAANSAWLKNADGAKEALSNILENHMENFHAAEFIELNKQVASQDLAIRGHKTALKDSAVKRKNWNLLAPALNKAGPKEVATAICGRWASEAQTAAMANEFEEFRKFVQWRLQGNETPVSIDFASVIRFERTLFDALQDPDRRPSLVKSFESSAHCSTLHSLLEHTLHPGRPTVRAHYDKVVKNKEPDHVKRHLGTLKNEDPKAVADWIGKVLRQKGEAVSREKLDKLESGFHSLCNYFFDMSFAAASHASHDFEAILTLRASVKEVVDFLNTQGADPPPNISLKAGTAFVKQSLMILLDIEQPQSSGPFVEEFI